MKFNDKLVFLMKLTNTTNSTLARATSLDASFISRLRSGAREPSKKQNYVSSIALFFARNIYDNYQKNALCDVLHIDYSAFPELKTDLKLLLEEWLLLDNARNDAVGSSRFLSKLDDLQFCEVSNHKSSDVTSVNQSHVISSTVTFGAKGKRELVKALADMILNNGTQDTIYLVSEENMSWFTEDPAFMKDFYDKIYRISTAGNKIKVIHNLRLNLNDMYSLMYTWLPLYVSGTVEPYYYPRVRDRLIKSTLIIAPKTGSILSFAIGSEIKNNVNMLITDKKTTSAYLDEFISYLSLCKPLIQVSYPKIKNEHLELLLKFEQIKSDSILKSTMFSSLTMSESTFRNVIQNSNPALSEHLLFGYHSRIESFRKSIINYNFTEIIFLPSIEEMKKEHIKANIFHSIGYSDFYYSKDAFSSHVREIIVYLETYPNYNVSLISKDFLFDCQVYVKKDSGTILSKIDSPMMIISITEPTLTDVIWNYLNEVQNSFMYAITGKENVIKKLNYILKELS